LQGFPKRIHYDGLNTAASSMSTDTGDSMSVDAETSLARAIQDHLDLKQRNAELGSAMPLDRYSVEDPFENHPLFKSEEQARLEETLESVLDPEAVAEETEPVLPWPGEDSTEGPALVDSLWGRSRDFDWGD
jgi:hypothetical protein